MGAILDQLPKGTGVTNRSGEGSAIREKIIQWRNEFREEIMSLTDGDISQYHTLMRSSVDEFLIKLDNAVKKIVRQQPEETIQENG